MISLRNVTKEFNLGEEITITPVRNVTLDISRGDFAMIIGRSGSGKSTLLNLSAGLIRPTSGEVLIENTSVGGMTDKQISALRSRKIGFVFQFPSLLPSLTVVENVAMPSIFRKQPRQEAYSRAAGLLEMLGLSQRMEVYPKQLSAGEQKRAVIARSLVNQPEILLADEPTSDLDEQTEEEIMALLKEIHAGGMTIMMITHSLHLIAYASRAFKMEDGNLTDVTASRVELANGMAPAYQD